MNDSGISDFSEVIMIGDSDNDAIGANAIGASFIGVTYGFGFKNAKEVTGFSPIGVAKSAEELKNLLQELVI